MVKPNIPIVNETGSDLSPLFMAGVALALSGPNGWDMLTGLCKSAGLVCYVCETTSSAELVISSPRTYYAAA